MPPWQGAAGLVGGAAVFAALAVLMGYLYMQTYLEDLGIPGRVLTFAPHQYALASSPLFVVAALYSACAVSLIVFWRYVAQRAGPSRVPLLTVLSALAEMAFILAALTLLSMAVLAGGLSDEVLPHLSPNGLRALMWVSLAALVVAILALPLWVAFLPPDLAFPGRRLAISAVAGLFLLGMVAVSLPIMIGHIDARLTLDADRGTQPATLLLLPDASAEGPWGSAENGRIEDGRLIFICEDYIYLLYRGRADGSSPTVHAIPTALVSRIDFFPGR